MYGFGTKYEYIESVGKNIILYAHWEKTGKSYEVKFDSQGGSLVESILSYQTKKVPAYGILPQAYKDGYIFEGWYSGKNKSGIKYDYINSLSSNMTLYAAWSISSSNTNYRVYFDSTGGNNLVSQYGGLGQRVPSSGNLSYPSRVGYVFEGWYKNKLYSGQKLS